MISDVDFVLIFQNSNMFNSVYRFIEVVPYEQTSRLDKACIRDAPMQHLLIYEQQNPCNICIAAADGNSYGLNVGAYCDKGHMSGATKAALPAPSSNVIELTPVQSFEKVGQKG